MPTQSRGFFSCDFCGLSCDTLEEATDHEYHQCSKRPPSQAGGGGGGGDGGGGGGGGPLAQQQQQQQRTQGSSPPPHATRPPYPPPPGPRGVASTPYSGGGGGGGGGMTPLTAGEMQRGYHSGGPSPPQQQHQQQQHATPHHPRHHPKQQQQQQQHSQAHPPPLRALPLMGATDGGAGVSQEDCIASQSLELFEATPEHAAEYDASRTGGTPVRPGQVGIRCVHCCMASAHNLPPPSSGYSTVFPSSLGAISTALRMIADHHLPTCRMAPPSIMEVCDRAAKRRQQQQSSPNSDEVNDREEQNRMTLLDYCVGYCQHMGIGNKYPHKTGIGFLDHGDGGAMTAGVETPVGRPSMAAFYGSGYRGGGGGGAGMPPLMAGGSMGGPDAIAPTPLQRRRDRPDMGGGPPEAPRGGPMYSADRSEAGQQSTGYPTPYSQGPPGGEAGYGQEVHTPAQPNFDKGEGGGGGYPTPHSAAPPSEGSPPGGAYNPYELPTNFPFYQETDRTWHCKFCSHMHPSYRDPQSIWSSSSGGPPPGNFIDSHLSMCRSYHQSIPSPPMYPGGAHPPTHQPPPLGYPPPYMAGGPGGGGGGYHQPPPGWDGGSIPPPLAGGMHPQHLAYPPPSHGDMPPGAAGPGGMGGYPPGYPPHMMDHGPSPTHPHGYPGEDPAYGGGHGDPRSRPGPPGSAPLPSSMHMGGGPPPTHMMARGVPPAIRSKEHIGEAMRHSISHLIAQENEYLVTNPSKTDRLVLDEDKLLLTDYFFYLMKQLRLCRFSESDRKTRGGKREKIKLGYGGLQCIHCADVANSRKFFWSNVDRLANSFAEIPGHVIKCRRCPQQTKEALLRLKQFHPEQMARLPRGSQKVFFRRMWRRLHDEDPQANAAANAISGSGGDAVSNAENMPENSKTSTIANATPPEMSKGVATPESTIKSKSTSDDKTSLAGESNSEESLMVLQRSTQEAAKALAEAATPTKATPMSLSSRVLLAIPDDKEWLSDMDCFIRKQLEVFCATPEDVATAQSDRKYPIHEGQVGIRCLHCSCESKEGANGTAVAFPFAISGIYESVREFQRLHLDSCENLNDSVKNKLGTFKGSSSLSSVLRKYYVLAAKALGLHDTREGIRSGGESISLGSQAAFSFAEGQQQQQQQQQPNQSHSGGSYDPYLHQPLHTALSATLSVKDEAPMPAVVTAVDTETKKRSEVPSTSGEDDSKPLSKKAKVEGKAKPVAAEDTKQASTDDTSQSNDTPMEESSESKDTKEESSESNDTPTEESSESKEEEEGMSNEDVNQEEKEQQVKKKGENVEVEDKNDMPSEETTTKVVDANIDESSEEPEDTKKDESSQEATKKDGKVQDDESGDSKKDVSLKEIKGDTPTEGTEM